MLKSILRLRHPFLQTKYHKFKVTRLPQQEFALMIRDDTTLGQLLQTIRQEFELTDTQLLASPVFTSNLALFPVNEQMKTTNQKFKEQPILSMILSNDLFVYQTMKDKAHLIYGLECLELNYTNNRNLAEKTQLAIINLSQEWENVKTMAQALSTPGIAEGAEAERVEERKDLQQILNKTIRLNRIMKQAKTENSLTDFVKKISLLMSANWIFLYAITFGLYGWDVGEPISYLSSAGVDLLALLRYFDLQKRLSYEHAVNEGKWMGLLNLAANRRQQRWLHCHLRRQLY